MNCSLCNATLPPGATRCPACGTEFMRVDDATVTETTPRERQRPATDSSSKRNPTSISHSFSRIGYEGHYLAHTAFAEQSHDAVAVSERRGSARQRRYGRGLSRRG